MSQGAFVGSDQMLVEVTGVNYFDSKVMVRDRWAAEFEVDGGLRPKGMGMPVQGERWMLVRMFGAWVLGHQVNAPTVPAITGSRTGLDPISSRLLDALAAQGKVRDLTTGSGEPALPPDPSGDPPNGDRDWEPEPRDPMTGDPGGTDVPPTEPDPITHHGGQGGSTDDGPVVGPKWLPLYIATYNCKQSLSAPTSYADVLRLANTRMNIIGFQEMSPTDRNSIFTRMAGKGWDYFRPLDRQRDAVANTIMWRKADFALLDSIDIHINDGSQGIHGRSMNIVKLLHKPSQRTIHFLDAHFHPHIEYAGGPRPDGGALRLNQTYNYVQIIKSHFATYGAVGPTYAVGDFNADYFAMARRRYPPFPVVQWAEVGAHCNWGVLGHGSGGTYGGRAIDQVWMVNGKKNGTKFVDQWVLGGYHSDHRPVLVKTMIRSNNHRRTP